MTSDHRSDHVLRLRQWQSVLLIVLSSGGMGAGRRGRARMRASMVFQVVRVEELLNRWERDDPAGQAFVTRERISLMIRGNSSGRQECARKRLGQVCVRLAYVRAYHGCDSTNSLRKEEASYSNRHCAAITLRMIPMASSKTSDPQSYLDSIGTKYAALLEKKLDNALHGRGAERK